MKVARIAELIVVALLFTVSVGAVPSRPKAPDVLALVEKNYKGINDYSVDVTASVKSPQMHVPKSEATIYYKKPDKVKIAAKEGFAVLPNTFTGNPVAEIRKNFTVTYGGAAEIGKEPVYVLNLKPKTMKAKGEMKLFVEKRRGLILKALTEVGGMKLTSKWSYSKVDGKYWMPSRIKIDMTGMTPDSSIDPAEGRVKPSAAESGTAEVKFSNYRINKGIADKVFTEKKDSVK